MQVSVADILKTIKDSSLSFIYENVLQSQNGDAAHDLSHLLRVAVWTLRLCPADTPKEEAIASALLHDFVNVPKNHPDRAKASEFSAAAAEPLLKKAKFSPKAILRIQEAIRDHSFSRGAIPKHPMGKALQDADRLEALGAIGIMRVFSTGVHMGARYFDEMDPWAKSRALDDKKFSIDHFFTKLLLLPETFLTIEGKKEAHKRAELLKKFLHSLEDELGVPS